MCYYSLNIHSYTHSIVRLDSFFRKYIKNARERALLVINPAHLSVVIGWMETLISHRCVHNLYAYSAGLYAALARPFTAHGLFWFVHFCFHDVARFTLCLKQFSPPFSLLSYLCLKAYLDVTSSENPKFSTP